MGDTHVATEADLARAGFGPVPAFHAVLAESRGSVVGAAIYAPLFSTTIGGAGAYVSDLWVDADLRGQGLGERLLAAVRTAAAREWGAVFLKLAVYDNNPRAMVFYDRLGFTAHEGVRYMMLKGAALDAIGGTE